MEGGFSGQHRKLAPLIIVFSSGSHFSSLFLVIPGITFQIKTAFTQILFSTVSSVETQLK